MSEHYLESMYKRSTPIAMAHRRRLEGIRRTLEQWVPSGAASWADFGCSTGFLIDYMLREADLPFTRVMGYDMNPETLAHAARRKLPNTEFERYDLNADPQPRERFDVVTCFETLEHVPDFRRAVRNLCAHTSDDGLLVVTIPNELGLIGLVKFFGRMVARRNPYGDFFDGKSRVSYVASVASMRPIAHYRREQPRGYGPHLGFDFRDVIDFLEKEYIGTGEFHVVARRSAAWNTGKMIVLRREKASERAHRDREAAP